MLSDRVWRLVVGPAGGKGIALASPLHIEFEVEKDPSEPPNPTRVRIWNLSPATRAVLMKQDQFVVLSAGYADGDGLIQMSCGHVVAGWTQFDASSGDVITEIAYAEGNVEYRDTTVSLGYSGGVTARTIIADIAKQMGLALYIASDALDRSWQHGFSHVGAARAALHRITAGTGLEWSIQNNTLQVITRSKTTTRRGIVLSASSGLLSQPERTIEASRELIKVKDTAGKEKRLSKKQKRDGWKVESLLMPQVVPGDKVRVESKTVTGWFRAESVKHSGDSHHGDWKTLFELVDYPQ